MAEVTLKEIKHEKDGRVFVRFSDGVEVEYENVQMLKSVIAPLNETAFARMACLSDAVSKSSDLTDISAVKDKPYTVDLSRKADAKNG